MAERKQCLILGPMSSDDDERKMFALQDMLQKAFKILKKDYDVVNPYDGGDMLTGRIILNVIREIDRAEIVVINITGSNPNVLYETAICHALGVPVILISENVREIPFYLRGYRCEKISFDNLAQSTTTLTGHIVNIDENNNKELYLESPVKEFFTRSIVDISPAIGVAQGYYYNLLRHARLTLGEINNGVWKHELKIFDGKDSEGKDKFIEVPANLDRELGIGSLFPRDYKYCTQEMVDRVENYKDCVRGQMIFYP